MAAILPERAVAYYCRLLLPLPHTKMDQNAEGFDASIPKKIVIKNVKYAASRPSWWCCEALHQICSACQPAAAECPECRGASTAPPARGATGTPRPRLRSCRD